MFSYYSKALDSAQLILYCVLIYWLSGQSTLPAPSLFQHQDKVIHAGAYFVMAVFALRAFRNFCTTLPVLIVVSLVFCSLFGISDEWHQSFVPGRTSDINDWLADTVGALLFLSMYYWYQLRRCNQNSTT